MGSDSVQGASLSWCIHSSLLVLNAIHMFTCPNMYLWPRALALILDFHILSHPCMSKTCNCVCRNLLPKSLPHLNMLQLHSSASSASSLGISLNFSLSFCCPPLWSITIFFDCTEHLPKVSSTLTMSTAIARVLSHYHLSSKLLQ